ncbi:MAG: hypothetical protein RL272_1211 [Candidatus Parcubacteria bacterium]|jgi:hypothetical protein
MPRTILTVIFLSCLASGCASSRLPPANASASAVSVVVAPPYSDPEYVLRFSLRDPSAWEQLRNLDGGEGRPDAVLRLSRAADGARIDVLFLPKTDGEPADWAGQIRAASGGDASASVTVERGGDRATVFTASGTTRTRHVVLHLRGMARSLAYLRLAVPTDALVAASADLDAIIDSLELVPTGPLSPSGRLARCLTDKGVRLYSTWWCGPCRMQQRLFGDGASRIDKTECSDPDETDQRPVCARAHVRSYPTWTFPDGSRLEGVQPLDTLADRAGCPLVAGD